MNNTFSITFSCRKSSASKKTGLAPIEMSVNQHGERWVFILPRKAKPGEFRKEMTLRRQTPAKDYTSAVAAKVQSFQTTCLIEHRPFNKETLREFILYGFSDYRKSMGYLFDSFLESQQKKVDAGLSTQRNYRKYEIVREHLYEYGDIQADTPLMAIRPKHIVDFNSYLLSIRDSTTVAGMMQKLKSVFLFGLRNRLLAENPFLYVKIPRKEKEVQFLTQEEVYRIRKAKLPTNRLDIYRDLFLFQCYSALSFIDMENLVPEDFLQNEKGYIYIAKKRAKTGVKFCTVLFEDAIDIARKYGFQLPASHVQNYNIGLKAIADFCRIKKPLHSLIARHTAACYLLNEKGLSLDVVARILGHSTTKITRHYAKLRDSTVLDAVELADRARAVLTATSFSWTSCPSWTMSESVAPPVQVSLVHACPKDYEF